MSERAMSELVSAMRQQLEIQTRQMAQHDEERAREKAERERERAQEKAERERDRAEQEQRSLMSYILSIQVEPYSGDSEPHAIDAFIKRVNSKVEGTALTTDLFLVVFSRNLQGQAKDWYDQEKGKDPFVSVEDFKERLINHFAKQVDYQIKAIEFNDLMQNGSIFKFNEKFDKQRKELPPHSFSEQMMLLLYIAKLKTDVQREVRLKHPKSIHEAMQIAEIYSEEKQGLSRNRYQPRYLRSGYTPRKEYPQREVSAIPMEVDTVNVKKSQYYSSKDNRNKKESTSKNARLNHVSSSSRNERHKDEHISAGSSRDPVMQKEIEKLKEEIEILKSLIPKPRLEKEVNEVHEDVGNADFSTNKQNKAYHVQGKQDDDCESLFIIPVQIKGTEYPAMIDSGAESNFIQLEVVKQLNLKPQRCEIVEVII